MDKAKSENISKNNKNLWKKIPKILMVILTIILVLSIPLWFIMSAQVLEPILAKILDIKIDPSISGGIVISKFYDDAFDDFGDGSYKYPLHENYSEKNICDLTSYEVYRPIISNSTKEYLSYWQVAVGLNKFINPFKFESGFSGIQIAIYIDIDGNENGDTNTYIDDAEYVKFPSNHGWDILIIENGNYINHSKLYYSKDIVQKYNINDYDMKNGKQIHKIFVKEQNKIYFQIPIDNKFIEKILDGRKTYHWVVCGFYDPLGNGNWLNIKEEATIRYGGRLKWEKGARIYDFITPSGFDQKYLFSIENADIDGYIILPALTSNGFDPNISYLTEAKILGKESKSLDSNDNQKKAKIDQLLSKIKEEENEEKILFDKQIKEKIKSEDPIQRLYALFSSQKFDEAQILVDEILKKDSENPVALAYKGSLIAMEGGKTKNPMQAINFVNKAYEYLDKACHIMENFENNNDIAKIFGSEQQFYEYYIIVLSNRAVVSSSVPDEVFNKLDVAISDFKKIAILYQKLNKNMEYLYALMQVATLLEKKGKKDEADVIWFSISKFESLPAKIELELLRRNFK